MRKSSLAVNRKVCRSDLIPWMHERHKTGKLEKACKKIRIIRFRMVVVWVLNMSVDEAANLQVHCPTRAHDWLRRYDEGSLEGLRDLPRCGRPRRIPRSIMRGIHHGIVQDP